MALTITKLTRIPLAEKGAMVIVTILGDGATSTVTAKSIGLQRVVIGMLINNDEATPTYLTAAGLSGTTLTKTDAFESSKTMTLIAIGF